MEDLYSPRAMACTVGVDVAESVDVAALERVVDNRADVNGKDVRRWTARHWAFRGATPRCEVFSATRPVSGSTLSLACLGICCTSFSL